MKKCIVFVSVLFLCMSSYAQDTLKNSVRMAFGSIISDVEKFSPSIDISYSRNIWKGLQVGLLYQHSLYNHTLHVEKENSRYQYYPKIITNSVTFNIDYQIKICNGLSLYPCGQIGVGWYVDDLPIVLKERAKVYSLGAKIEYMLSRYLLFLSYDYYRPNLKGSVLLGPFMMQEYRPNQELCIYHHEVKFGVGVKF